MAVILNLLVPVYFRKASYVAGDYPIGALNSLNFSVIAILNLVSHFINTSWSQSNQVGNVHPSSARK